MDYTTIYTYQKAWKLENRIYSVMNYKLLVPLYPRQILYFSVVLLCMIGLSSCIGIFARIPWVLRFLAAPYLIGNFLLKKKLDGKSPIKYFLSWVQFSARRGQYLDRFRFCPARQSKERFRWYCVKGTLRD